MSLRMSSRNGWSRGDHASAEEHDVRVDRVHERDRTDGQVMRCLAHQAARQRVAGVRRLRDRPAGELVAFQRSQSGLGLASPSRASWARLTSAVADA